MKLMIIVLLWCLLFVVCWPLALALLVLIPVLYLLSIPLRIALYAIEGLLSLIRSLLLLPARCLRG
jgi:hypothetical protein